MTANLPGQLLSVPEAASRLGVSRTKTFALIAAGELRSLKVGGLRRVPVDALLAYIAEAMTQDASARVGAP